jgi:hypothetical protein
MQRGEAALRQEGSQDVKQSTKFLGGLGWITGNLGDYKVIIMCLKPINTLPFVAVHFSVAGPDGTTATNLLSSLNSTMGREH